MGEYKDKVDSLAEKIDDVADELEKQKTILKSYVSELKGIKDSIGNLEEKK